MRVTLITDYRDYYDHIFHAAGNATFRRMAHDRGMPKYRQFEILKRAEICTPPFHAIGSEQANKLYGPMDNIVAYTDEYQHCGEGKELLPYGDAVNRFCLPGLITPIYCTSWINTTGTYDEARSYRYLQIGAKAFWLRYEGKGGWMSNHAGDTEIYVEGDCEPIGHHVLASYPMFAIDFVIPVDRPIPDRFEDVLDRGVAIDFNTAPGLKWTGIEDVLSAIDVYDLISDWHKNNAA